MKLNKDKIKNVSLVVLAIGLLISILYSINLNLRYSENLVNTQNSADSLATIISLEQNRYDSLKAFSDSIYSYELKKNDSLWQVLQSNQTTNKTKTTYIYKDSTIIKEAENTETQTQLETKYVTQVVEKEVVKTVHDTVYVSKVDSTYDSTTVKTQKEETNNEKIVVDKGNLFNIYLDGNVKVNLDKDIIPELEGGIILFDKFYGSIGIDYFDKQINPFAKIGINWRLF